MANFFIEPPDADEPGRPVNIILEVVSGFFGYLGAMNLKIGRRIRNIANIREDDSRAWATAGILVLALIPVLFITQRVLRSDPAPIIIDTHQVMPTEQTPPSGITFGGSGALTLLVKPTPTPSMVASPTPRPPRPVTAVVDGESAEAIQDQVLALVDEIGGFERELAEMEVVDLDGEDKGASIKEIKGDLKTAREELAMAKARRDRARKGMK